MFDRFLESFAYKKSNRLHIPLLLKGVIMNFFDSKWKDHFPCFIRSQQEPLKFEHTYYIIFGLFGIVYFAFHHFLIHSSIEASLYQSVNRVFILFLSYKLMRELSPDTHYNYFFSMMILASSLCYPTDLYISGTIFLLLTTRLITRSSGEDCSNFELFFLTCFAFVLFVFSGYIYPINLCIALIADYFLDGGRKKQNLAPAVFMAALSSMWFLRLYGMKRTEISIFWIFLVTISGVLFIYRISILRHILTMDDKKNRLLQPSRIKAANANLIITLLMFAIAYGKVTQFSHLWILMLTLSLPYWKDIYLIKKQERNDLYPQVEEMNEEREETAAEEKEKEDRNEE